MNSFIIKKSFHFHAAHRNEDLLDDKCFSIHGHTYYLDCHFILSKDPGESLTILFSDIESRVTPIIEPFEHSFIINRTDPLLPVLEGKGLKLCILDHTSSVENLAMLFFRRIKSESGLNLVRIDFKETSSSMVSYLGDRELMHLK